MNKYIIESRYEYRSNNGIKFTNWYVHDSNPLDKDEANEKINQLINDSKFMTKKTKLKYEFRLANYNDYIKHLEDIITQNKKSQEAYQEYIHSDTYKEIQKKQRQHRKELKEKQK